MPQKVLKDRDATERGGDVSSANDKLTAEEKEFTQQVEVRAAQAPTDYGSSDYMTAYGDEYQMSTVFTRAAQQTGQQTDKQRAHQNSDRIQPFKPAPFFSATTLQTALRSQG